jgi:hypothetical protein
MSYNDIPIQKLELKPSTSYDGSENTEGRDRRMSVERVKVNDKSDPLAATGAEKVVKSETLVLRSTDEVRVSAAMVDASKKKKTGSIFSVNIDISSSSTLGLGVKNLKDSILTVSMLKRKNGVLGLAESAGIRLGKNTILM